jgi:hypothetical protein
MVSGGRLKCRICALSITIGIIVHAFIIISIFISGAITNFMIVKTASSNHLLMTKFSERTIVAGIGDEITAFVLAPE